MPNPRVLLVHANGLRRIIGIFDPATDEAYAEIEFTSQMEMEGPQCSKAALVSATPKLVTYKEIPT